MERYVVIVRNYSDYAVSVYADSEEEALKLAEENVGWDGELVDDGLISSKIIGVGE